MDNFKALKTFIDEASAIAFATSTKNWEPNVVAIGYKYVIENKIFIVDVYLGKTRDNCTENNSVAIAVWKDTIWYQIKWTARYLVGDDLSQYIGILLPELEETSHIKGIVEVTIDEVFTITPIVWEAGSRVYPR